ncbi:polysaccharide biosynthesis/export family protein [Mucilaginibacter boryungensis]|uniref:Polysaccharide export protein n=1 Tax=Mucilaginibacter boryungensis TaxID=768480 RepID=A0ABR9XFH1_9SPHI|nr:polysaccharide biosynthesis/export family protein [Mucilaginibacter boryungensis]MBE9666016.1 polysaccharide export protein [Mucilaginibacter boryungensis]
MRFKILPFLGVICLLCFSCSYKQQHALFQDKPTQTANITQGTIPTAYHIKADDILQIRNLENYKFLAPVEGVSSTAGSDGAGSQTYQVEEDGSVTLPVIGHIPVAGLTRYEAARKIEKLYRENLLKNAIIELKVLNLKVTVLGEIKSQGNYPLLKDKTTLIDIIGQAGGLNNAADEKNVKIIRKENGSQKTIWVDLSDVNILNSPNIILQDDDIVYIAQNKRAVRDDKIQNFSTLVQPSLLIFNTALIIYTLFR